MATTDTGTIYTALMAAQKEMGPLLKNATNPHFKNSYADLGQVIETITDPLHNNDIVWLQTPEVHEGVSFLRTILHHIPSGTELRSDIKIVSKDPDNPQAMGAAITYVRRYTLVTMCGLAPEDDDGNAAARQPREQVNHDAGEISTPRRVPPDADGRFNPQPQRKWEPDASDRNARGESHNPNGPSEAQFKRLFAMQKQLGMEDDDVHSELYVAYGIQSRKELTRAQYAEYTDKLDAQIKTKNIRIADDPFN